MKMGYYQVLGPELVVDRKDVDILPRRVEAWQCLDIWWRVAIFDTLV